MYKRKENYYFEQPYFTKNFNKHRKTKSCEGEDKFLNLYKKDVSFFSPIEITTSGDEENPRLNALVKFSKKKKEENDKNFNTWREINYNSLYESYSKIGDEIDFNDFCKKIFDKSSVVSINKSIKESGIKKIENI